VILGYVVVSHVGDFGPHTFGTFIYHRERAEELVAENNARNIPHVRYTVAEVREIEKP
jgi:hypothetical protein